MGWPLLPLPAASTSTSSSTHTQHLHDKQLPLRRHCMHCSRQRSQRQALASSNRSSPRCHRNNELINHKGWHVFVRALQRHQEHHHSELINNKVSVWADHRHQEHHHVQLIDHKLTVTMPGSSTTNSSTSRTSPQRAQQQACAHPSGLINNEVNARAAHRHHEHTTSSATKSSTSRASTQRAHHKA
eukprot:3488151-Amphidinium_carterae.1